MSYYEPPDVDDPDETRPCHGCGDRFEDGDLTVNGFCADPKCEREELVYLREENRRLGDELTDALPFTEWRRILDAHGCGTCWHFDEENPTRANLLDFCEKCSNAIFSDVWKFFDATKRAATVAAAEVSDAL